MLALTETMAAEFQGSGLHITALCPTFVKTAIVDSGVRDGRIAGNASGFAGKVMKWTGIEADGVARKTLDALDRNQLYVLPQVDARAIWRMKRLAPSLYARGAGVLSRLIAAKS